MPGSTNRVRFRPVEPAFAREAKDAEDSLDSATLTFDQSSKPLRVKMPQNKPEVSKTGAPRRAEFALVVREVSFDSMSMAFTTAFIPS